MWGDPSASQQQPDEHRDRYTLEEAWNQRLLVRPIEYIEDMPRGEKRGDAIKVNVYNLDTGVLYRGALWFGGYIIKAFKTEIGTPFIGYPTKEAIPNSTYRKWVFVSLAGDPATEQAAQAYIAANPEFMAPIPEKTREVWGGAPSTAHHERGPAPDWAGAIPARPSGPPAPPAPPVPPRPMTPMPGPAGMPRQVVGQGAPAVPVMPPQPPAPPVSAPPAPPVPGAPPAETESMMDRLRRHAEQPLPFGQQAPGQGEQQAGF